MKDIKTGFLFDLDGVLIDSETEYTRIWKEIDRRYPTGIENFAKKIKGMTLIEIVDQYFPEPDRKKAVPELLYDLESRMHYDWLPGARKLLEWLKDHNIPTVLVTSSNKVKMGYLHSKLPELESYFSIIVTGDNVTRSKPDPEGYLLGAELCGCNPENCVVFEDSLQGVKAGEAAGAFVVGVEGTLSADVIAPHADLVVKSLIEIDPKSIIDILKKR